MQATPPACEEPIRPLELWGGHECTVNRVGDRWFDQTRLSGHQDRLADLELFAGLGIRKLRYPALWERIAPDHPGQHDFRWTDERLPEIERLGMEPILTLCHHGSGPRYTSLMDDGFAPGLARHAAAVAQRYPSVEDYTPVNEPLTTARFSTLYGFWYPHLRDETACWNALLNQTDATRLAMRAIRGVNPAARLVQTDDLGFCHASEPLQRVAAFQNDRRWMTWDLLCGTVVPGHPLWERLARCGLGDRLRAIADDPCPPDIVGVNHYLSSERHLDHRVERHGYRTSADQALGESDGVVHVDVDAVRSLPDEVIGLAGLVEQAWQRYGIPVAITECHNACTREEQARWFVETWHGAKRSRRSGVDLRAVTAWSLLGSFDWNRMLTRFEGHYEPGVFDLRGGGPRPTMMVELLEDLAGGGAGDAPGLGTPGWWRRQRPGNPAVGQSAEKGEPLLIVGDDGALTTLAVQACEARALDHVLADDLDVTALATRPWAVLDLRGPDTSSPHQLGRACTLWGVTGAFLAPVGSDTAVAMPALLTVEHGPVFAAVDASTLPARVLDAFDAGDRMPALRDAEWRGVYGPALIDGAMDLLLDGATGHVRFVAAAMPEAHFARALAEVAGYGMPPPDEYRPLHSSPIEASHLPHLTGTLERFVSDRRRARAGAADMLRHDAGCYLEAAE